MWRPGNYYYPALTNKKKFMYLIGILNLSIRGILRISGYVHELRKEGGGKECALQTHFTDLPQPDPQCDIDIYAHCGIFQINELMD